MSVDWTDKVCLAAFHHRDNAQRAVAELEKRGFDHKQVGIVHRDEQAIADETKDGIGRDHGAGAAVGAGSGAVLGTIVGAAAAFVFPPVGLVVVAGALLGLATGAVAGGVLGALTGMGIPKETAEHYHREFEAGRAIVVVMCEGRASDVLAILRNHGGYQLDEAGRVVGEDTAVEHGVAANPAPRAVESRHEPTDSTEERELVAGRAQSADDPQSGIERPAETR